MRVIAGKYKGTKLVSPHGEVRPTTDLVKGSLFSVLEHKGLLRGSACLDLFCGSGALGIEALSRGADSCVFVDINTINAAANLDKLKINARMIKSDFRRALRMLNGETFDLVFCDPPYKSGFAEETYRLLVKYGLLGKSGVAVLEHSSENNLLNVPESCIIDSRNFGAAAFEIVRGECESDIGGNV